VPCPHRFYPITGVSADDTPYITTLPGPWVPSYLLLAVFWGCSFALIEIGLRSLTPVGVALVRLVLGALTLLLISAVTRTALPPRSTWRHLLVVATLLNAVPFVLFAYGETHVSSSLVGIVNAATPLATLAVVLLAFPEENPTRERLAGLAVGFTGVVTVLGLWRGLGSGQWLGVAACGAAVCCYGIAFPYARRYLSGTAGALSLATGQTTIATVLLLPAAAVTGVVQDMLTWAVVLAMLGLGCLGTGIAYILNFTVVTRAGGTVASTVTYLTPVVAVGVGVGLLGENLRWNEPLGAAVVVLGAALAKGRLTRTRRADVAPVPAAPSSGTVDQARDDATSSR